MKSLGDAFLESHLTPVIKRYGYKTRREEIIGEAVNDINLLRQGTKFKLETTRSLAIRINKNPFLRSDTELELVMKKCREQRKYAHLYWLLKG